MTPAPSIPRQAANTHGVPMFVPMALAAVLYCVFAFFRLGSFDLAPDEGRFGLSGANILRDYHQLAKVSEGPLGNAGTKPYFYPLTLAVSIALLGPTEVAVRCVNGIALLLSAVLLYHAAALLLRDQTAAFLSFVFFLLNPGTITYARAAMPEPLTVCCGCAALCATARWMARRAPGWAALSGIMLGLGFVTKIWLVLPFVLACGSLYLVVLSREKGRMTSLSIAAWLASLAIVSASHILLVLALSPADIPHWVNLYSGITLGSRFAGAGYDPEMWYRPWWFYAAAAFKGTFFAFPLVILGCLEVLRRRDTGVTILFVALIAPLALFSVMRIKQASYIYPVFPGLMMLIALGCLRFLRRPGGGEMALACLGSIGAALFFFGRGVFGARELMAIASIYIIFLTAAFATAGQRRLFRAGFIVVSIGAMLLAGVVAAKTTLDHRTGFREIASFFQSKLADVGTREVTFIAPEFPSMEFYTFRRGEYWQSYYFHQSDDIFLRDLKSRAQTFYIVDPSGTLYGGKVSAERLAALTMYAKDLTREIERHSGRKLPVQVFVPWSKPMWPCQ
jgi:4-amino-4-deoxy-L-arabinose transferase-like glycosyltransferase